MATNNAINISVPVVITKGGTAATSLTDHAVLVGSGTTAVTAISVGTTGQLLVGTSSADPAFASSADGSFSFNSNTGGVERKLTISNTDNSNSASAATLQLTVGGASTTGDPSFTHVVTGISNYRVGPDNSVTSPSADPFIISSNGTALNTFYTTGENRKSLQPAFLAYPSTSPTNVTGDGTEYTLAANTEIFDQNNDWNTSTFTFTAPVTGIYLFSVYARFVQLTNSFTGGYFKINTSNHVFKGCISDYGDENASGQYQPGATALADMDASDTCTFIVAVSGSTLTIDITGNARSVTRVSGYKVV